MRPVGSNQLDYFVYGKKSPHLLSQGNSSAKSRQHLHTQSDRSVTRVDYSLLQRSFERPKLRHARSGHVHDDERSVYKGISFRFRTSWVLILLYMRGIPQYERRGSIP